MPERTKREPVSHEFMENLLDENKRLQSELDRMKENVLVQSLNDMKEVYEDFKKKHEKEMENAEILTQEVADLRKQLIMMRAIVCRLKNGSNELQVAAELFYRVLSSKVDDNYELNLELIDLDNIYSSCNLVIEAMKNYLSGNFEQELRCADGKCAKRFCTRTDCQFRLSFASVCHCGCRFNENDASTSSSDGEEDNVL